jgi:hypothetical protein
MRVALDALLARHESLRTTFRYDRGEVVQVIASEQRFSLTTVAARDDDEARQLVEAQHAASFSLTEGPLIRGSLIALAADSHILALTVHHIVADGWSMSVLIQDLAELYSACREQRPSSLPVLDVQYADYAQWQAQRLSGDSLNAQVQYWRGELSGAPSHVQLPVDRVRPSARSYRGACVGLAIPKDLTASLQMLARQMDTTLFTVLCAGWSLLLQRLSGQADFVVGIGSANRQHPGLERVVGFFVNTLPLRIVANERMTVRELLWALKQSTLAAYAHQELPLERRQQRSN